MGCVSSARGLISGKVYVTREMSPAASALLVRPDVMRGDTRVPGLMLFAMMVHHGVATPLKERQEVLRQADKAIRWVRSRPAKA
jgi:hypothetical protein